MSDTPTGAELGKKSAAQMALEAVRPGMRLGLGSGSTAEWFVRLLGERVANGLEVSCAASSRRTAELARARGIDLREIDAFERLDLYVDGADEIDPALNLIKGGGACHLIEKIVASAADEFIVIADDSKLVETLGAYPLPLEIARNGWRTTARRVAEVLAGASVGGREIARRERDGEPVLTDESNFILDCALGRIDDPRALAIALNAVPGLIEHGLFLGMASRAFIGGANGNARLVLPQT